MEDLWAFNTMPVIQAVYDCNTPIISAVGHETDFTLCDFVADLRAPTPSAAAELVVPDINSEMQKIDSTYSFLLRTLEHRISGEKLKLDKIKSSSPLSNIDEIFNAREDKITALMSQLKSNLSRIVDDKQKSLSHSVGLLNAVNPLSVLSRGFSITKKDERPVNSVTALNTDDVIYTEFVDGSIKSVVCEVNKNG